ncbi:MULTISPECIES: DUF4870 domain-containing protein [Sphingobacterium]|uniref:DUF4870 domain-containing protein n=1 Tax=Sphingobacterium tenebrionis TaxID=3111775 RepID=A0ABU8I5Q4_9SPHI|nr:MULTISPECIES: DUF4870 domain-containing protein [unclassified Sphingobacterium]QBR10840.1 DUF4870 domain-containing protein [Sphingobacterium sp. CZ-2]
MEHQEGIITFTPQQVSEDEREYASNSYLMSLFALFAGLPLPIFNLLATIIFVVGKKRSTKFVRWHGMQALISQIFIFFFNTVGFWWTISVILHKTEITNYYIAYIFLIVIINIIEIVSTIYTSIQTRKGIHVRWFLFSDITDNIIKP